MSCNHDDLRSLLDTPEAAIEKLAEIAVVGQVVREIRKDAGLPDKVALSLNDVMTTLSDLGGRVTPHLNKAIDWGVANPMIAGPALGAAGGALIGAGSGLVGRRRKKNLLGNALTGGLAGGAIGLGVGAAAPGLKGLISRMQPSAGRAAGAPAAGGIPGDVVPPSSGAATVSPMQLPSGESPESYLQKLREAEKPTLAKGVHSVGSGGASWASDLIKRNPVWASILAGDVGMSTASMADAAALGTAKPRISTSLADFRAGFNRISKSPELIEQLKNQGIWNDDVAKALGNVQHDDKALQNMLLQGLAGKNVTLNVPAVAEVDKWTKTIDSLKGQLAKLDPSGVHNAVNRTAGTYDEVLNELGRLEQMNPDAMETIARLRKSLDRSAGNVATAFDKLPDNASTVGSIDELLRTLSGKPPQRTIDLTPSQIGNVSRAAVPSDRWTAVGTQPYGPAALARAGYTLNEAGQVVPRTSVGLRGLLSSLKNRFTGGGAEPTTRTGRIGRAIGSRIPTGGRMIDAADNALPAMQRFLGRNRRIPIYDSLGPKGRIATRMGIYALPVLIDMYMQGQRQKAHGQALADALVPGAQ